MFDQVIKVNKKRVKFLHKRMPKKPKNVKYLVSHGTSFHDAAKLCGYTEDELPELKELLSDHLLRTATREQLSLNASELVLNNRVQDEDMIINIGVDDEGIVHQDVSFSEGLQECLEEEKYRPEEIQEIYNSDEDED